MEIRYQFFEKEKLLIQRFRGFFSFEHYRTNNQKLFKEFGPKGVEKVLIDFREMLISENEEGIPENFDEKYEEVVRYRKMPAQAAQMRNNVKVVFWVDAPLPTVIAYLFVNSMSNQNYDYCTTEEKIIESLDLDSSYRLEEKIKDLANLQLIS